MPRISDTELVSICESEMSAALGIQGKEISEQRTKALDYYLGDMDEYLPVEADRSKAVSRDVADTVEWILPSLMRIFSDADNCVVFTPVGPEDENAAETETDVVDQIFWQQNEGFLNLYTFCKDALLQKTGIFKCWWDEPKFEREEYSGLTQEQFLMLLMEPGCQYEILDQAEYIDEQLGIPLVDVTLKVARRAGKVCVDVVPPEEFGISSNASSPNPKKANFLFHRRRMTAAELIADGYSEKLVKTLPFEGDIDTNEGIAKSQISGDLDEASQTHWSMRTIWVSECYLDIDRNGDGIAEKWCVKLATSRTGTGNSKLLDANEVDSSYISAATPVMMTHKFYGQSVADLVLDIQEIRSALLRGILDNTYLANNGRTAVNERVNLDDLLASRPGGVVRTEGSEPPGNHIMPLAHTPLPQQSFGLLEVLDQILKQRTGVGDEVMGLDANSLANVNTGVIAQAYDSARMRIEMIARILAEVGVKDCFKDIHELTRKHQDIPMVLKLRNEWVQLNPSDWRERTDCRVQVGIGNYTRERMLMSLTDISQLQQLVFQAGGMGRLMNDQNIYNMLVDRVKAQGLDPARYFTDPQTVPPPQPKPDPAEILAQIEMKKVQIDEFKVQSDAQIAQAKLAMDAEMQQLRAQVEMMKGQQGMRKMEIDEQSQILNAQSTAAATSWKAQHDELALMLDKYKAELASATTLESKLMEMEQRQSEQMSSLIMELDKFRADLMKDDMDRTERVMSREAETDEKAETDEQGSIT